MSDVTDEIVKFCKVHGDLTEKSLFSHKYKSASGKIIVYKYCLFCRKKTDKALRNRKVEIYRKSCRDYYYRNKDYFSLKQKNWSINNKERRNEINKKTSERYIKEAKDHYIRALIKKASKINNVRNIPENFIECYKQNILLKRKLKEIKNGSKEHRAAT